MTDDPTHEPVTQLLLEAGGTPPARLLEIVYDHLRRLAELRMKSESPGHTLQATALVHEAYAKLVDNTAVQWQGRAHFFAAAAEAMQRILVDHARARASLKRGGAGGPQPSPNTESPDRAHRRIPLNLEDLAADADPEEILSVDLAFQRLQEMDPDLARVVRLRFFAGLTEEETALALGVSDRTIRREWTIARAWLRRWLDQQKTTD